MALFRHFKLTILALSLFCLVPCYAATDSFDDVFQAGVDDAIAQNYADARDNFGKASFLAKSDLQKSTVFLSIGQI